MVDVPPPSSELIRQAQAGDSRAFQVLVTPHLGAVRRIAYAFCRNRSDADDLAQDALLKAFRSFGTYSGGALHSWLYTVTRSVCRDWYRRIKVRGVLGEVELDAEREVDPTDDQQILLSAKVDAEGLWSAIRRLDDRFRVPLVLSDIEGLSYEEVARIEQIPVGTVRSRLSRARKQLAELVSESLDRNSSSPGTLADKSASSSLRIAK